MNLLAKMILATLSFGAVTQAAQAMCTVELQRRNGQVIETFRDYTCPEARNRCEWELESRQRRGMNPHASCVIVDRGDRGGGGWGGGNDGGWGGGNGGGNGGGWGGGGGRNEERQWQQVDEVHFRDGKTANAIRNCKAARERDFRCTNRDYSCSPCSEIDHSDHSSYIVYQLLGRGGRDLPRTPQRRFIQTFHFRDNKTAVARQKCESYRAAMPQCGQPRQFECTPCTVESHTDHSQFDLYSID